MENLQRVLDDVLGGFVCNDAGIYKGQCPQLIRYFLIKCGVDWPGKTGNGNKVIDTLVNDYGGYYGESTRGYRICSADVKGNDNGHCWIELLIDGKWVVYEQNSAYTGQKSADFGCGKTYAVGKRDSVDPDVYNIRYAGHPSIDLVVDVNQPKPTPTPSDTMPDWFKTWAKNLAKYINDSVKE